MNWSERWETKGAELRKGIKKYRIALLVIGVGLFLLALPVGRGEQESEYPQEESVSFDLKEIELHLEEVLSRIEGAGEVTVILTVKDGTRQILAQDIGQGDQEENSQTVILSRGNSQQETVTIQEIYPQYQGALLVCSGGEDPEVRLQLTKAVTVLTGLGADKISISKGK